MSINFKSFFLSILLLLFIQNLSAQMMIKAEGDVFNLPELSAIIIKQEGKVSVVATMVRMRPADYKKVDVKQNDQIFMVNGKKIKSVKQLQNMYEDLAIGEEFKMAIKRGDDRKLVSFVKADPKKLPKHKMMTKTISPEEAAEMEKSGGMKMIRKTVGPKGKVKTEVIEDGDKKKDD